MGLLYLGLAWPARGPAASPFSAWDVVFKLAPRPFVPKQDKPPVALAMKRPRNKMPQAAAAQAWEFQPRRDAEHTDGPSDS